MKFKAPLPKVPNDTRHRIMARNGDLMGHTASRSVWRFGFIPHSEMALAFDCATSTYLWVLADNYGRIIDQTLGFQYHLPQRYTNVIEANTIIHSTQGQPNGQRRLQGR